MDRTMPSGADLFVVCKNCGSEVSPYITECPYCGHRLRRRAPKIPRAGDPPRPPRRGLLGRWGSRGGGRPAPEEAPRRAARPVLAATIAERPYATIALVAASCVIWVLLRAGFVSPVRLLVIGPLHGEWWKLFSSQFSYVNGWYAFFTLLVVAIFGWLLERRFGAVVVLALFLGAGVAGALVALAVYPLPVVLGGNAGALALLAAWAAADLRAARAGHYYEGDLLGAGALAALILALPFVRPEASWLAGVTGGALGLLVGFGLQGLGQAET
jgi:membrane associated rhomboid family serine protease